MACSLYFGHDMETRSNWGKIKSHNTYGLIGPFVPDVFHVGHVIHWFDPWMLQHARSFDVSIQKQNIHITSGIGISIYIYIYLIAKDLLQQLFKSNLVLYQSSLDGIARRHLQRNVSNLTKLLFEGSTSVTLITLDTHRLHKMECFGSSISSIQENSVWNVTSLSTILN